MMKPWYLLAGMALAGIAVLAWANPVRNLEAIAVNVGTGLVGTALAFLLLNYYLPRISNAYGKRTEGITYSAIAANIARSRYRVRILSTFVYPLTSHSDYRELHDEFVNALATALRANGRLEVRILILDPASDAAKQRSEERDDDVIRRIRENLLAFHRLRSGQEVFRRIDVKLFDRLPPLSMFEWDDRASMSFYPRNKAITETSRFDFSTSTPLGTFMDDTFDDVWTDEKTRALDESLARRPRTTDPWIVRPPGTDRGSPRKSSAVVVGTGEGSSPLRGGSHRKRNSASAVQQPKRSRV
jgi:hypothetical protein